MNKLYIYIFKLKKIKHVYGDVILCLLFINKTIKLIIYITNLA